jgi:hypothetical protein
MFEAKSKEKHSVWYPMPELTITLPYVHSKVDFNTVTMGNPMPVDLNLCQSRLFPLTGTLDLASGSSTICCIMHLGEKRGGGGAVSGLYWKISQKISAVAYAVVCVIFY